MKGTITRMLPNKGYGFVRGEDGLSRFMHASVVVPRAAFDTLREGQSVEFDPSEEGPLDKGNGLRAENVRPVPEPVEAQQ